MGAGRKLSLAEHTARERKKAASKGQRGNWAGKLKNWHAKDAVTKTKSGKKIASIDILLAAQAPMVELAVHSWPKVVTQKEKEGGKEETNCFNTDYCCFEDLNVIEQQFRYDDAGRREFPPLVCPHCRFLDWLRIQIQAGEIDWKDYAFKFQSDKAKVSLHAGGVCGMFGGWDLGDEDKEELRNAGINLKEAYRENAVAKVKFIYCVIDLGDLDKGIQATIETKSLGAQLQAIIDERVDKFGDAVGDPAQNPYPFNWRFYPDEKPADMYAVSPIAWDELVQAGYKEKAQAIELAQGTKIPAVFEQLRKYPNVKQLRSQMEQFCLLEDVPWDEIFAPVEAMADEKGWVIDDEEKKSAESETDFPADGDPKDDGDDSVDCGACGKPVGQTDPKCKHCGAVFDDETIEAAKAIEDRTKAIEDASNDPPPPTKATTEIAKAKPKGGPRGKGAPKKLPPGKTPEEVHGTDDLPWSD